MRYRSEKFKGMSLFLKRIVGGRKSFNRYFVRIDFKGLICLRSENELARYFNGRAYIQLRNILVIIELCRFKNYLYALKAASVIKLNKADGF